MTRVVILLFVIMMAFAGCAFESEQNLSVVDEAVQDENVVLLADVDFVTVPGFTYYVLLEEKLGTNNLLFVRRYVKYDGFADTVSEELQEAVLPRQFKKADDAKAWLQVNDPGKLRLLPNTYVSASVQVRWDETEYQSQIEEAATVSLESLKRKGAVSRLNEVLTINKNPDPLVKLIEALEEEHLRPSLRLKMDRNLEPLSQSFTYQMDLVFYEEPLPKTSSELVKAKIYLVYQIDELGNPLAMELLFDASYDNRLAKADQTTLEAVDQVGTFTNRLYSELIGYLDLYGVNTDNPTLSYANVTLTYEEEKTSNRITKRILIR